MYEYGRNYSIFVYLSGSIQWIYGFHGKLIMAWLLASQLIGTPDIDYTGRKVSYFN